MDDELSTFDCEEATNRLRKILNESKGMVLDKGLLRKIEIELEKRNSEIVELLKNAEARNESRNFEEHILKEIKRCEGIVDVIGEGLCLLNKDLKVIWAIKRILGRKKEIFTLPIMKDMKEGKSMRGRRREDTMLHAFPYLRR